MSVNKADVVMIIYKRIFDVAHYVPQNDFISRLEELIYIADKVKGMDGGKDGG